ncbi:MAG: hypothetical protein RR642_17415 [Solibacillus sp.]
MDRKLKVVDRIQKVTDRTDIWMDRYKRKRGCIVNTDFGEGTLHNI